MTKKHLSVSDFTTLVKGAKVELNGTFKSPFVIVNLLNKATKGDFSKIEGVGFSHENLQAVAKVLKGMHANRYAFDLSILCKYKGVFCNINTSKKCPSFGYDLKDIDKNGYIYYKPIPLTINAYFSAFAKVAKIDISDKAKAQKESEKAARAAKKQKESDKKAVEIVNAVFGSEFVNSNSIETIREKAAIIKSANKRK